MDVVVAGGGFKKLRLTVEPELEVSLKRFNDVLRVRVDEKTARELLTVR